MSLAGDQNAAKSTNAAKHRIRQIYKNRNMTPPSGAKLDRMAQRAKADNGEFFDIVRRNPGNYVPASNSGGGSGGGGSTSTPSVNRINVEQQVAALRAEYGLPPEPASDAIWVNRIANGTATVRDAERRIAEKATREGVNPHNPSNVAAGTASGGSAGGAGGGAPLGGGGGASGDADGDGINDELTIDYNAQARAMFPWLPEELLAEFIAHWTELENEQAAWGKVRQSGKYDKHFPGIKLEDGSLRMSEQQYLGEIDGIGQAFQSFGIPANTFAGRYHKFIENGQGADQVRRRLATRYTEVASMSTEIRSFYAEKFGTGQISMGAILASSLDPTMNPLVAEEQFRISQIGGTGREFGFELAVSEAERLSDFGMSRQAAQGFFGQARGLVPTMRELAQRHNDPDDDFDIEDAAEALIFLDPEEQRRVKRLFAAEESSFTGQGGMVRQDRDGGLTGLRRR